MNSTQEITEASPQLANGKSTHVAAAKAACARLAPLWPLKDFVAVNPFNGLTNRPFLDVCKLMAQMLPGGMQMPASHYLNQVEEGAIQMQDVQAAMQKARKTLKGTWAQALAGLDISRLTDPDAADAEKESLLTVAEAVDRLKGTNWASLVVEEIGQFCAAYFDERQSAWRLPWQNLSLYAAWKEAASLDANMEILGLAGFRNRIAALPPNAEDAIVVTLTQLGLSPESSEDYLHKLLLTIRGWAGFAQYKVREKAMRRESDSTLLELLAVRLAYDSALFAGQDGPALREFWPAVPAPHALDEEVLVSFLWQLADEHAWQRQLFGALQDARSSNLLPSTDRPAVQAVFCIDVRSEVFRRALEAASPGIETLGFAGFFGLPIEHVPFGQHHGTSQCPVLLVPQFRIQEQPRDAWQGQLALERRRVGRRVVHAWNAFKTSAISCFSFVETAGLVAGPQMLRDAFFPAAPSAPSLDTRPCVEHRPGDPRSFGMTAEQRVKLALGALRNMGLTANFARLVVFCGHGSQTANNPYASALDCGACGGHAGDSNARVAAAILNDSHVRQSLVEHGITIPVDTWFVGALHNTTTDEVTVFDLSDAPDTHRLDIASFCECLQAAGDLARAERAGSLGLDPSSADLSGQIRLRSLDWAQVRPEWGLAGNAAFIAAPRGRTKGAHLDGRVFLHNYDYRKDPDDHTLELILCAPMVVATWINLQYYASTVNNAVFGSGNKITHNVVGTLGVCQGNAGDLQTGLPWQSVHDGNRPRHAPIRLHVVLEAPRTHIDAIIARQEAVRHLIENGWLLLFALENTVYHRLTDGSWEPITAL